MRKFLLLCALFGLVYTKPAAVEDNVISESIVGAINECIDADVTLCLKEKALKYTERIAAAKQMDIYDGVSLINTGSVRAARSYQPLPDDPKQRELEVETRLVDNVGDFLDSHVMQFKLPGATSDESRALEEEGRGKKKKKLKKLLPLLLILKLKLAALIPLFLGIIAFAAFKALLLGKIAFFFSAIQTIQKLLKSKSGGSGGWSSSPGWSSGGSSGWSAPPASGGPYQASGHPEESHGWDSSQGWGRSKTVDAQSIAYSGYNNNAN